MHILSIAHPCIVTNDLEKTAAFYCEALGLTRHFDFTRKGEVVGFYLKAANETFLEVFLKEDVEITKARCLNHFCLETGDIEALRQRLVDLGYKPGEFRIGSDQSRQFWIDDPNGLPIEFQQYTPESSQRTGRNAEMRS